MVLFNTIVALTFMECNMSNTVDSIRTIKKYPNRRLYDTETSTYITLADVKQLVLDNVSFKVVDAKSNEDITRSILLQIILELEGAGVPMFNSNMLKQIIRFYGHAMQGVMGSYLEKNMQAFVEIQSRLSEQSNNLYGNQFGADAWTQFMNFQAPMLNNVMSNYVEQSKTMFLQMQEQMQNQTQNLLGAFPFPNADKDKENK